ncbi:MAG TPA: restriction endonuclease subunit S [Coleofasciculaceae cyanobacterium]|jgi:type I restriction enzyme S subunit
MSDVNFHKGYKSTDIGVIPEDWKVNNLSEIAEIIMGQSPTGSSYNKKETGIALINGPTEFTENHPIKIQWTTSPTKLCKSGDVLLCIRGSSTGRMNIANDTYCIGRGITAIRARENSDNLFLEFMVQNAVKNLLALSAGSTFPNLDSKSLRKIEIVSPPLPEQKAIARVLSDVDELIRECDSLLAKKRNIKQGTMQQLLTGKKRLPGFSGEWEVKKLGDIFDFKNGLNKEKKYFGEGTPIVNYMDVYKNNALTAKDILGRVTVSKNELKTYEVCRDDVFFTRTSETVDEIGIASVIIEELENTVFSGFILRARPKNNLLNTFYKKYCFSSQNLRKAITSKSSYTTRALTNGRILSNVEIFLPTLCEQKAIAQILSDMDAEIEGLEKKRDKYKAIKQGMMQELLTGKTRLINN